jgi:hypothetical protein
MNKVIDGKVYNTKSAEFQGEDDNGMESGKFDYVKETLYKKRTGEYFLHGEGGANSRYGEWHGNTGSYGEKIMPLSLSEAKQWAEEHLDGDEYESIFGDPEPDEGKTALNLYVSNQTKATLQRMSEERGVSISKIVEELAGK